MPEQIMDHPSAPQHPGREERPPHWSNALLWTAGVISAVAAMAALGMPRILRRGSGGARGNMKQGSSDADRLSRAVLGRSKKQVVDVLGPPPAATSLASASATSAAIPPIPPMPETAQPTFWDADTWYYPLSDQDRTAIAIAFDRGRAHRVDFIQPPRSF
jgi:hypothetical protein